VHGSRPSLGRRDIPPICSDAQYVNGKIQEKSMCHEHRKHDGFRPIVGVNIFLDPHGSGVASEIGLARSVEEEMFRRRTPVADKFGKMH
jgi:methylmalonyl-CoA mutase